MDVKQLRRHHGESAKNQVVQNVFFAGEGGRAAAKIRDETTMCSSKDDVAGHAVGAKTRCVGRRGASVVLQRAWRMHAARRRLGDAKFRAALRIHMQKTGLDERQILLGKDEKRNDRPGAVALEDVLGAGGKHVNKSYVSIGEQLMSFRKKSAPQDRESIMRTRDVGVGLERVNVHKKVTSERAFIDAPSFREQSGPIMDARSAREMDLGYGAGNADERYGGMRRANVDGGADNGKRQALGQGALRGPEAHRYGHAQSHAHAREYQGHDRYGADGQEVAAGRHLGQHTAFAGDMNVSGKGNVHHDDGHVFGREVHAAGARYARDQVARTDLGMSGHDARPGMQAAMGRYDRRDSDLVLRNNAANKGGGSPDRPYGQVGRGRGEEGSLPVAKGQEETWKRGREYAALLLG